MKDLFWMFIGCAWYAIPMGLVLAQVPPQAPPLKPAQGPPVVEVIVGPVTYADAYERAVKERKRLAVFIGAPSREIKGVVTVSVLWEGFWKRHPDKSMAVYQAGSLELLGIIQITSPDDEVRSGGRKAVQAEPSFFGTAQLEALAATPVGDDEIKHLTFLHDLEPYVSAKRTQVSFRRWSGYIGSSPRADLGEKWMVAGGLIGVHGWSNQLFKKATASVYLGRQDAGDDSSTITWHRSYADGAIFADVLRNDAGKVFEVRSAEKRDGRWDRYIAYKDATARPGILVDSRRIEATKSCGLFSMP